MSPMKSFPSEYAPTELSLLAQMTIGTTLAQKPWLSSRNEEDVLSHKYFLFLASVISHSKQIYTWTKQQREFESELTKTFSFISGRGRLFAILPALMNSCTGGDPGP